MAVITILKSLFFVAALLGAVRIAHLFRARKMRAFAARSGLQYIGPGAPPTWWWNPSRLEIHSPLPVWVSRLGPEISQVWNVIGGKKNGVSVLIFDSAIWRAYWGTQPCTFVACQTEQYPLGTVRPTDRIIQNRGWTVLYGVWFLWFSWTMGTTRIEEHLGGLRPE
jgi:hypothetical protein